MNSKERRLPAVFADGQHGGDEDPREGSYRRDWNCSRCARCGDDRYVGFCRTGHGCGGGSCTSSPLAASRVSAVAFPTITTAGWIREQDTGHDWSSTRRVVVVTRESVPYESKRWALNRCFDEPPSFFLAVDGRVTFPGIPAHRNEQVPESSRNTMHRSPMQGFLSNGHTLSVMTGLLFYRLLQVFREIAVRHDRRARVNMPFSAGLPLHFAKSLALGSIMDG
jgi:hypothetical protein